MFGQRLPDRHAKLGATMWLELQIQTASYYVSRDVIYHARLQFFLVQITASYAMSETEKMAISFTSQPLQPKKYC